jgi:hypothetical protein
MIVIDSECDVYIICLCVCNIVSDSVSNSNSVAPYGRAVNGNEL